MSGRILVSPDLASQLVAEKERAEEPAIGLCDTHADELDLRAMGPMFTDDDRLKIFHVIAAHAAQTMGTVAFKAYPCPICLFKNFDFIGNTIQLVEERKRGQVPFRSN